jgi:hypothetical protein
MNWISRAVIKEFDLEEWRGKSAKEEIYDGKYLVSTGKGVDLACPQRKCQHRFYVFEDQDVSFGILLGAEFTEHRRRNHGGMHNSSEERASSRNYSSE